MIRHYFVYYNLIFFLKPGRLREFCGYFDDVDDGLHFSWIYFGYIESISVKQASKLV